MNVSVEAVADVPLVSGVRQTLSNRGSTVPVRGASWTQRVTRRSCWPTKFWSSAPPEYSRALSAVFDSTSSPALSSWLPSALTRSVTAAAALSRCSVSFCIGPGPPTV